MEMYSSNNKDSWEDSQGFEWFERFEGAFNISFRVAMRCFYYLCTVDTVKSHANATDNSTNSTSTATFTQRDTHTERERAIETQRERTRDAGHFASSLQFYVLLSSGFKMHGEKLQLFISFIYHLHICWILL